MFLLASCRKRLIFSVSARDVRLDQGGAPAYSGSGPLGWRAAWNALHTVAADAVNTLFPDDCLLCGGPLLRLARVGVCEACTARLQACHIEGRCTRCGDALGMESARFAAAMGMHECTACRLAPPAFERAVAFTAYDDTAREMLHLLKFQGMTAVARHLLGEGMAEAMLQLADQAAPELLVIPVPLFRAREKQRGFNQATLLAEAGMARLRKRQPRWTLRRAVLERTRDTRASYALDPRQRRQSLRGAFRVRDAEAIRGREVLLADDVLTTGATARECARVLRRAGATKVWVATYARTFAEAPDADGVAMWAPQAVPSASPG